jgi:hypothetical protein
MRHADKLLAQMNLTVSGAIDRASLIGTGDEVGFATFEPNFFLFKGGSTNFFQHFFYLLKIIYLMLAANRKKIKS